MIYCLSLVSTTFFCNIEHTLPRMCILSKAKDRNNRYKYKDTGSCWFFSGRDSGLCWLSFLLWWVCFLKVTSSFFLLSLGLKCPLLLCSLVIFFMIWTPGPGVFEVGLLTAVLCCLILCALGGGEHRIQVWPVAEYYMKGPESPASEWYPL